MNVKVHVPSVVRTHGVQGATAACAWPTRCACADVQGHENGGGAKALAVARRPGGLLHRRGGFRWHHATFCYPSLAQLAARTPQTVHSPVAGATAAPSLWSTVVARPDYWLIDCQVWMSNSQAAQLGEDSPPGRDDAPAVLLVHGFGAFGEQWRGQVQALTRAGYQARS